MRYCNNLLARVCLVIAASAFSNYTLAKDDPFIPPPAADTLTFKEVKKTFKIVDDVEGALELHNRILIGNYRVGFNVAKSSYAREEGGQTREDMGGGWERVTSYKDQDLRATAMLQGVNSEDLNRITEKAYQDLISRLQAAGREVVTMDQIKDSKVIAEELELAKLDSKGEYWTNFGIGSAREMMIVTWPKSIPLWFMFGDTLDAGASFKAAYNALKQKNFGFLKRISGEQNAAMVDISVTVRFADTWSQRSKTLRKAKVGVDPNMKITLNKIGFSSAKVTRIGTFPGPSGTMNQLKDGQGFGMGNDWANYSLDTKNEESWTSVGQTLELVVTAEPGKMEEQVLKALYAVNAAIAAAAKEYPAKK
jgi:hypothetical protein